MAEGNEQNEWSRWSVLLAVIANCHRDPKKGRAFKPADFDPCTRNSGEVIKINRDNISLLKQAFGRSEI